MVDSGARHWIGRVINQYPVRLTFIGSLLLSLIAVLGAVTVGRDAALYLDIAHKVNEQGPAIAWTLFDWPWFPLLLAQTHIYLGLPLELSAYLWCALFIAGTCALMVDCVRQRLPQAAPWAALVVLAMPAVNAFRDDIIRECGFWFFSTLTLWLALHWQARGGWLRALLIHLALGAAALFRLEAVLLLPALTLWQLPNLWSSSRRMAFLQFILLPLLGGIGVLVLVSLSGHFSSARVSYYLEMINPRHVFASFNLLSEQFANSLISDYSRNEAGRIIFFGVLVTMLMSVVKLMGPFAVPFIFRRNWGVFRTYWNQYRPFAWAAVIYLTILMLFFIRLQFMNSRYLSFLNLLLVPALALALLQVFQTFPRLGKSLVVIGLLVMLSNVVSTSAGKTQYVEAGRWFAANTDTQAPAYFEDGRIGYYAGRGYAPSIPREQAMSAQHAGQYRYFLIEAKPDEAWLVSWLGEHNMKILASFANRKGARVLVIGE
ncbi:hypothetical protein GGD92_17275 [Pseudomonas protegens]|uniref:Glycosyltransferase RgtA/B/C/D-like domain-containing protein n=1 Tax=Pseudomonas protegens TaxID=380021 RepID=A0A7G7XL09_9PSED|nr:hypothetical protein GGI48_12350 [Pseudomonas protegens]QNL08923.1 hypothetical protein GGD92_17275 [Pseudomonas protegens]